MASSTAYSGYLTQVNSPIREYSDEPSDNVADESGRLR